MILSPHVTCSTETELSQPRIDSRKSIRWSAVSVAPKLVYVRCGGEKGSNPKGANDLCWARIEARIKDSRLGLEL